MSFFKGTRSASRRKPSASNDKTRQERGATDRKMRSLQSLQERLSFTLKRPRTRRHKKGGPNSPQRCGYGDLRTAHPHELAGTSSLVESGLIQIPHLQGVYYESPSPLSVCSSFAQESGVATLTTTTTTTATATTSSGSSSCSSINTHVSATHSPISSLEYSSSDDGFSCDEVMSLVSCPDMVTHNVLDFMPYTTLCPDMCEGRADAIANRPVDMCEDNATAMDQGKIECPSSCVEDEGEPYRIDLCDFEPDMNALSSPPQDGPNHQKSYGGGVLCLRLDYEEVMRAWKERGECLIPREPIYYPSPYLDPFHNFSDTGFVPHSPFF